MSYVRDLLLFDIKQDLRTANEDWVGYAHRLERALEWEQARNEELLGHVRELKSGKESNDFIRKFLTDTVNKYHEEKKNLRQQVSEQQVQIAELRSQLHITNLSRLVEGAQRMANGAIALHLMNAQAGKESEFGSPTEAFHATYAENLRACKFTPAHFDELKAAGLTYAPPKLVDWEKEPVEVPTVDQGSAPAP